MKIAIAGLSHETNTFAVERNDTPESVIGREKEDLLSPHPKSFVGGFLEVILGRVFCVDRVATRIQQPHLMPPFLTDCVKQRDCGRAGRKIGFVVDIVSCNQHDRCLVDVVQHPDALAGSLDGGIHLLGRGTSARFGSR